ncbi:MAG TPA: DUF2975 domain-containing protein [Gemmatimonadaceae bacterium]|nr:DUF2975 domain-containing protein [Gemmatimonadaceae bacterium]
MSHSTALPVARTTLRFLIVLNWISGSLIFALLAISFWAEEWTWRALGVGSVADHESTVAGMRAIMVVGIVGVPIAHVVLGQLLRIVESVRARAPFSIENPRRLRAIAWALVVLEVLHVGVVAIASAVSTPSVPLHITSNFNLTGWLAILLLFVLAQVFLEGARMREDLEGMI